MANKIRIGITERGDAAINHEWVDKLSTVHGAIIITKNVNAFVREALLANKEKCILHATTTGWGRSVLEPNVPHWEENLQHVYQLVQNGFPANQVVIRVDPIMPWNLQPSQNVIEHAYQLGFRRFRISILDTYAHMTERFHAANLGVPSDFGLTTEDGAARVNNMLSHLRAICPEAQFEACAEPLIDAEHIGCISTKDLDILGIQHDMVDQAGYQRKQCMCYSGKIELLSQRKRCPHGCLYCYWRD